MYIWQWQHTFIDAVKNLLRGIFKTLELPIAFNVFAIAIPIDSKSGDRVIFYPPKSRFASDDFERVFAIAKHNFNSDPEQFFFMGSSHQNKAHKESLYPKALLQAVSSMLQDRQDHKQYTFFCSFPVQKNQHWVIVVIQLTSADFDSQYRLTKQEHEVPSMRKRRIERCFLEAIIYRVLKESELELQRPSEGNIAFLANSERVIEDAASSLLDSIEVHINKLNKIDLLSFANAIAAARYEGGASEGRLIICQTNHSDIFAKIKLKNPIDIYNYRGIRKLLEVSSNQMALLCDIKSVWGLGIPLDTYNPNLENLFEIRFSEHHTWELVHAENIMLRVRYRQPRLPRSRFDRALFCDRVHRLFKIDRATANRLIVAIEAAVKQRHGTMLVITPEANQETLRLAAQSTVIEPVMVTEEIISHISSVDGAILISPDGVIHSFGVILDGKSTKNGSSTRGARYNSAIRYIDGERSRNINCLALIVSEDGYVDLYPTLTSGS